MSDEKARTRRKIFRQTDLTQGCVWKSILSFSLPILLSYLLQNFYGMADAAICGHTLSPEEVSGVGDTSPITFIFLQFAFGCTAGMSTIVARHVGKKDTDGARRAFAVQLLLSVFIIAVLTAVSLVTIRPLLALIGIAPSEEAVGNEVFTAAKTYLTIICGGMAGQFFYNVVCCVLRSIGDSKTPLFFLAISTTLNVGLDLIFILALRMGVAGAAAATVISQSLSAVGCFIYAVTRYKELRPRAADFKAFSLRSAFGTLWQGVPLGLQFSILAFGLITMQNGVVAFDKLPGGDMVAGTPAQLGYGAACRMDNLFMTPYNALATAMISFTAQNRGAGDLERIRRGTLQCFYMMLIYSAFALLTEMLLSIEGAYQYAFLAKEKVTAETVRFGNLYLYSVVPFLILLGGLLLGRNVMQGYGKPLFPLLAGVAELVGRIVICLTLPRLANGAPIDAFASSAAFFWLGFADAGAWILTDLLLVYPLLKYVFLAKPSACPHAPAENAAQNVATEEETAKPYNADEKESAQPSDCGEKPPEESPTVATDDFAEPRDRSAPSE